MIKNLIDRKIGKNNSKSLVYLMAVMFNMVAAFVLNVIMTNNCSPENFGLYKYATNFILTVPPLLGLGINHSCGRLVASKKIDQSRNIIGLSIATVAVWSTVIVFLMYLASWIFPGIESYFDNGIKYVLPFIPVFMLKPVVGSVYTGKGEIYKLSFFTFIPFVIMISATAIIVVKTGEIVYSQSIYIFLLANAAIVIPRVLFTKFQLKAPKESIKELLDESRINGFKVYLSSIFTTSASQILGLVTGSLVGYTDYAMYSLALSLAGAFTSISSSIATSRYRENVNKQRISRNEIKFLVLFNVSMYIVFYLVIDKVFFWIYPVDYTPAVLYLKLLAVVNIIYGISFYFNRFLIGKRLGKNVLVNSILTGTCNIIFTAILVPVFGILGLIISSMVTAIFNLTLYIIAYIKYTKTLSQGRDINIDE